MTESCNFSFDNLDSRLVLLDTLNLLSKLCNDFYQKQVIERIVLISNNPPIYECFLDAVDKNVNINASLSSSSSSLKPFSSTGLGRTRDKSIYSASINLLKIIYNELNDFEKSKNLLGIIYNGLNDIEEIESKKSIELFPCQIKEEINSNQNGKMEIEHEEMEIKHSWKRDPRKFLVDYSKSQFSLFPIWTFEIQTNGEYSIKVIIDESKGLFSQVTNSDSELAINAAIDNLCELIISKQSTEIPVKNSKLSNITSLDFNNNFQKTLNDQMKIFGTKISQSARVFYFKILELKRKFKLEIQTFLREGKENENKDKNSYLTTVILDGINQIGKGESNKRSKSSRSAAIDLYRKIKNFHLLEETIEADLEKFTKPIGNQIKDSMKSFKEAILSTSNKNSNSSFKNSIISESLLPDSKRIKYSNGIDENEDHKNIAFTSTSDSNVSFINSENSNYIKENQNSNYIKENQINDFGNYTRPPSNAILESKSKFANNDIGRIQSRCDYLGGQCRVWIWMQGKQSQWHSQVDIDIHGKHFSFRSSNPNGYNKKKLALTSVSDLALDRLLNDEEFNVSKSFLLNELSRKELEKNTNQNKNENINQNNEIEIETIDDNNDNSIEKEIENKTITEKEISNKNEIKKIKNGNITKKEIKNGNIIKNQNIQIIKNEIYLNLTLSNPSSIQFIDSWILNSRNKEILNQILLENQNIPGEIDNLFHFNNYQCYYPSSSISNVKSFQNHEIHSINEMNLINKWKMSLLIWNYKDSFLRALNSYSIVMIMGSIESGRSTQIPQYILEYVINSNSNSNITSNSNIISNSNSNSNITLNPSLNNISNESDFKSSCNILLVYPNKNIAISLAKRIAMEMNEKIGSLHVGFQVEDGHISPKDSNTSIVCCTLEILLNKLSKNNLFLKRYGYVILDGIEERSLSLECSLLLLRDLLQIRPELKLIFMGSIIESRNVNPFIKYMWSFHPRVIYTDGNIGDYTSSYPPPPSIHSPSYPPSHSSNPNNEINGKIKRKRNAERINVLFIKDIISILDTSILSAGDSKEFIDQELNFNIESVNQSKSSIPSYLFPYSIVQGLLGWLCQNTPSKESILIYLPGWKQVSNLLFILMNIDYLKIGYSNQSKFKFIFFDPNNIEECGNSIYSPNNQDSSNFNFNMMNASKTARKIILSTSTLESNLIFFDQMEIYASSLVDNQINENIFHVIDSARIESFFHNFNMESTSLLHEWISQNDLLQRMKKIATIIDTDEDGSISNLNSKIDINKIINSINIDSNEKIKNQSRYYCLMSKIRFKNRLNPYSIPEIIKRDTPSTCLFIKEAFSQSKRRKHRIDIIFNKLLSCPNIEYAKQSITHLQNIQAIQFPMKKQEKQEIPNNQNIENKKIPNRDNREKLTRIGKLILEIGIPPLIGKMIIYGIIFQCLDPIIVISSLFLLNNNVNFPFGFNSNSTSLSTLTSTSSPSFILNDAKIENENLNENSKIKIIESENQKSNQIETTPAFEISLDSDHSIILSLYYQWLKDNRMNIHSYSNSHSYEFIDSCDFNRHYLSNLFNKELISSFLSPSPSFLSFNLSSHSFTPLLIRINQLRNDLYSILNEKRIVNIACKLFIADYDNFNSNPALICELLNRNSNNKSIIKSILFVGLYPNIIFKNENGNFFIENESKIESKIDNDSHDRDCKYKNNEIIPCIFERGFEIEMENYKNYKNINEIENGNGNKTRIISTFNNLEISKDSNSVTIIENISSIKSISIYLFFQSHQNDCHYSQNISINDSSNFIINDINESIDRDSDSFPREYFEIFNLIKFKNYNFEILKLNRFKNCVNICINWMIGQLLLETKRKIANGKNRNKFLIRNESRENCLHSSLHSHSNNNDNRFNQRKLKIEYMEKIISTVIYLLDIEK